MSGSARHVLMTADAVGGVWTYALTLGRGLAQAGVRVTLAVPGPEPDVAQLAAATDVGLAVEPLGGALDWTAADEAEVAASAVTLHALTARLRPDLLHLNSPALAAFGPFPTPVVAACHSCVKTWWSAVKAEAPLPDDLAWRSALVERGYANAQALLAPSQAFAEATRAAYSLKRRPYVVLNGRTPLLPPLRRGTSEAGGGPLSPPQGVSTFTAGRLWDEGKDVATLDRAVGRADLEAAAAGPLEGPGGQAIRLDHLTALGRLSEAQLASRLLSRPIFVSPSLYEPFGLAVLEAAGAGCPLVLSDIETFRELWDGAALFFPPGDDASLATLLGELAADPDRRGWLGEAARTRAARYTAQGMTDATLRLYATLSPAFGRVEAAA